MSENPQRFALIGAAGFVAPRHMRAIRDTGHTVVAALDPHDNVGVLDSYFPEADFFTEFERFDRALDKAGRAGVGANFISICSPNYLHDAHIRFALRNGADAICEKPIIINPWNLDALQEIEMERENRIWTILQLRLHPAVIALKERIAQVPADIGHDVDLSYVTSRGRWYQASWKGNESKSGGVAMNIGVHFFDMLGHVFGPRTRLDLHALTPTLAAGYLEFKRARVRWLLSIDARDLPPQAVAGGRRTHRSLCIGGEEYEFSDGFTDLHTESYAKILAGEGFGLEAARPSIETTYAIRQATPDLRAGDQHPALAAALAWRGEGA